MPADNTVSPNSGRTHYKVCLQNSLLSESKLITMNLQQDYNNAQGAPFHLMAVSSRSGTTVVPNLHSAEQEQSEQLVQALN